MEKLTDFRLRLKHESLLVAPGCYDCIGARAIEAAGFDLLYVSGGSVSAALGFPDYALITLTEMADVVGRISEAVKIPVIADADTGFGVELNVVRTVIEYERRGAAGLHIEDQQFGKRCGHVEGKHLIPLDDYIRKIRAACLARKNPDFLIIARTDAIAVEGFESAITRANAALQAGADMIFVEAPEALEQVRRIPQLIKGPCLLNVVINGKTPPLNFDQVREMGYKMAIVPAMQIQSLIKALELSLSDLKRTDALPHGLGTLSPAEIMVRLGEADWKPLVEKLANA